MAPLKTLILKLVSTFVFALGIGISPAMAQDGQTTGNQNDLARILEELKRLSDEANERASSRDNENQRTIEFQALTSKHLPALGLRDLSTLIEGPPGVAEKTRVWVAKADVSRLPGLETIVQVKSPVTCGRIGCNITVLGTVGGTDKIILETMGETIESQRTDRVRIVQGTGKVIEWRFNGARFATRSRRR